MVENGVPESWGDVAEQIVQGLAHEINNRLLALMGVRELGEGGLDPELLRLFDDELSRLEAANRVLRRLGQRSEGPEILEGSALLDGVRELHARNASLRGLRTEWSVAAGLPAVRVDPVAAERALLWLLASCGAAAGAVAGPLTVTASSEGETLLAQVTPSAGEPGAGPTRALEGAGATVERTGAGVLVRFPAA